MSTIAEPFRALVDDAAIFPPGEQPLSEAITKHRNHLRSNHAALLGTFVVDDRRLPDLLQALQHSPDPDPDQAPLPVSVVVTGGAGAVEPAVRWATGPAQELLDLRGLELALRDEDDLAHNARRMTTMIDQLLASGALSEDTVVYVEPPPLRGVPSHSWLAALDELATWDLRVKLRTGGLDHDAFPAADALAQSIVAALDRELPFKCTAGLHRAVAHVSPATGFAHHGFLNVLLATRASLDGATTDEVAGVLGEHDAETLRAVADRTGPDRLVSTRRWFTGFGSCRVEEPLADLRTLGLYHDPAPTDQETR